MANSYRDVIRVESTEAGLIGILRSGMLGFESDRRRMVRKSADNSFYHWTPDELKGFTAADIYYTNTGYPSVDNVQEALDTALNSHASYFANIGVTGIPYWGDGIVEQYVSNNGSAVYSSDGSVYLLDSGFTGLSALNGCKFLVTPVKQGTTIKFADGGNTASSEYSDIGYTGIGTDNCELHVTARTKSGAKANLLLKAYYGKIILQTSTVGSNNDGIKMVGKDYNGTTYAAGSSSFKPLYTDENNEVVVGGDAANRYTVGGFTGLLGWNQLEAMQYPYCTYEIEGHRCYVHFPASSAYGTTGCLTMCGVPAAIQTPSDEEIVCWVRDDVTSAPEYNRLAHVLQAGDQFQFFPAYVTAGGALSYGQYQFSYTGTNGIARQTIMYYVP